VTLRIAIVDDEPLARDLLHTLLGPRRDVEIVGSYASAVDAIEGLQRAPADVLLLDVSMPETDGFQMLARLEPELLPVVIFTTAYDQHALRAWDVSAVDYLLKPIAESSLARAVERARSRLRQRDLQGELDRLRQLMEEVRPARYLDRLPVRTASRILLVPLAQVSWLQAEGNHVVVHTSGGSHSMRDTLGRLHELLDPEQFARISRSAIVNIARIREVQPWFHGDYMVILDDNSRIASTRSYRDRVERLIGRAR
jgi:two-component system, LytTR family, response regulator